MTADVKELIDKLRDPRRVYPDIDDASGASKIADILENALVSQAPTSIIDLLKAAAENVLRKSQMKN
jgi:hypothetical protein